MISTSTGRAARTDKNYIWRIVNREKRRNEVEVRKEQNRIEQNRTGQDRTGQYRTKKDRNELERRGK